MDHTGGDGVPRPTARVPEQPRRVVRPLTPELAARAAPLQIDTGRRDAVLSGSSLMLTRREYDLLLFLAGHPGRVFTRPQLLKWVWGYDIISGERTVDVHIRRLRRKLRQQGPTITTVRGIGYRLDDATRVDVVT
jgi:DNA-binding response OmpR family regulator